MTARYTACNWSPYSVGAVPEAWTAIGWAWDLNGKEQHQAAGSLTNAGTEEQRQINQLLNKPVITSQGKETEARTMPKQHRLKGTKKGK